jgi:hypothetical protein
VFRVARCGFRVKVYVFVSPSASPEKKRFLFPFRLDVLNKPVYFSAQAIIGFLKMIELVFFQSMRVIDKVKMQDGFVTRCMRICQKFQEIGLVFPPTIPFDDTGWNPLGRFSDLASLFIEFIFRKI